MNSKGMLILGPLPAGGGGGGDVVISPAKDNLLKKESDGLKVLASHPIIPKIYASSYSTNKSGMVKQSMPDGAVVYRGEFDVKNPLGITKLNNVSIYTMFTQESRYFYLGENNEFVTVQACVGTKTITPSTITCNIALIFSGDPFRAFDVYSGQEVISSIEGNVNISVGIYFMAGTTMRQNDFD